MAIQLDELNPVTMDEGLDTHVIAKKIPVTVGKGSKIFEVCLWVCGIIPGLIFSFAKTKAQDHFDQLQQRIQANASTIDNYMEQRVMILKNCARLLDRAIDLDKSTFENIARLRSGNREDSFSDVNSEVDSMFRSIQVTVENYPTLQAHKEIADAMQQNVKLQREITAARELYNDTVNKWNRDIFDWPAKRIVAAKNGYTTRIPFIASQEVRNESRGVFF